MRSSEYWRRRAELLTQQIENGEKVPMQRVIRLYKAAFDEIDADIRKIQSTSDAVNKAEIAALKRELVEAAAVAPDTARMRAIQNSISAYKFRIDRAELVKQRAYAHLMKAAGRAAAIIKPLLKDTYKAARYGTIDDIASGLDCGVDFSLVPERTINKIIEAPFHGKNYSQRVWDNTAETAGKAQKILTQGMVKGDSYSKMARSLSKLCNNTFYNSFRLISTEAAHFTEEGRFDAYNDLGILGFNRFCLKPASDDGEWQNWTPYFDYNGTAYEFFYAPGRGLYEALIPSNTQTAAQIVAAIRWENHPPTKLMYGKITNICGVYCKGCLVYDENVSNAQRYWVKSSDNFRNTCSEATINDYYAYLGLIGGNYSFTGVDINYLCLLMLAADVTLMGLVDTMDAAEAVNVLMGVKAQLDIHSIDNF